MCVIERKSKNKSVCIRKTERSRGCVKDVCEFYLCVHVFVFVGVSTGHCSQEAEAGRVDCCHLSNMECRIVCTCVHV